MCRYRFFTLSATEPHATTLARYQRDAEVDATQFLDTKTTTRRPISYYRGPLSLETFMFGHWHRHRSDFAPTFTTWPTTFFEDNGAFYNWDYDLSRLNLDYLNFEDAQSAIREFKEAAGESVSDYKRVVQEGLRLIGRPTDKNMVQAGPQILQPVFDRFVAERLSNLASRPVFITSLSGTVRATSLGIDYSKLNLRATRVIDIFRSFASIAQDGSYVFPNLLPGEYRLEVVGKAATAGIGLVTLCRELEHHTNFDLVDGESLPVSWRYFLLCPN